MHIRDLVRYNLIKDDERFDGEEGFARWAWGPRYGKIDFTKEGVSEWNKFHKDIFVLDSSNDPEDDIPVMMELWRKHREG